MKSSLSLRGCFSATLIFTFCLLPVLQAQNSAETLKAVNELIKKGRLPEARQRLAQALELWPRDFEVLYAWGLLMEQIGDLVGAIDAYQDILTKSQKDPYALSYLEKQQLFEWQKKAKTRLDRLTQKDIELEALIDQYKTESMKIGNDAYQKNQIHSARHVYQQVKSLREHDPEIIKALHKTHLQMPEPGPRIAELDENLYEFLVNKARRLTASGKSQKAIDLMSPYISSGKKSHTRLNYMMAEALRKIGKVEHALLFYDIYLLETQKNTEAIVQKTRQEIIDLLPRLTSTLKKIHARRKVFIRSLIRRAQSNWKKNPRLAQQSLDEVLKVDPENRKAQQLLNRIRALGSIPLFKNDLRHTWTLMKPPPNRSIASYLSPIRYKNKTLTLPKRSIYDREQITLIGSPLTYPNYGLLSAQFKVVFDKENPNPNSNLGFGFAIKDPQTHKALLLLTTWEQHTNRIAVRGMEEEKKGHLKSLGAMFSSLKNFDDWILFECFKRGNDFEFYLNKVPTLRLRMNKNNYTGNIGLFAAGNTVQVKNYFFNSDASWANFSDKNEISLFNRQTLAGWWRFKESVPMPLQRNTNIFIHENQMRLNAPPGIALTVQHEHVFPEDFIWKSTFQAQPNSNLARAEWMFGYDNLHTRGYRVIFEHTPTHIILSLLDDNAEQQANILSQSHLSLPESPVETYDLSIEVADKQVVVSIANTPLISATLQRPTMGSIGLNILNQIFSLSSMSVKKVKSPQTHTPLIKNNR